ncbi:hypothetical protein J2T12_005479 [Paenibacillus anaericanus]|uniref:hypothetical protein n=1 Tax=Paenibacillus anaericanus TaxID=170367 RepID=UPI002784F2C7|nr:hypothetical protein [Paenibacillus anaericanus]MDQ0092035.1 hypothetical protein [Paenibacillus anaericanus]
MNKIHKTVTNYLHIIVLPLLVFTLLAGYIYVPAVYAETDDILEKRLFPASERVRTEVNFVFSYPTNNVHIVVSVKQTSFETGEIITNLYEFEDPSLNSKYQLGERKLMGGVILNPYWGEKLCSCKCL